MKCLLSVIAVCLLLTACAGQTPQPSTPTAPTPAPVTAKCTTKECFVAAANECDTMTLTLEQPAATFSYATQDCVLTKTLVSLNPEESQQLKTALEGKSMTCTFEKGKFDERWIDSLIFGSEYCQGELKDALGNLLAFA